MNDLERFRDALLQQRPTITYLDLPLELVPYVVEHWDEWQYSPMMMSPKTFDALRAALSAREKTS